MPWETKADRIIKTEKATMREMAIDLQGIHFKNSAEYWSAFTREKTLFYFIFIFWWRNFYSWVMPFPGQPIKGDWCEWGRISKERPLYSNLGQLRARFTPEPSPAWPKHSWDCVAHFPLSSAQSGPHLLPSQVWSLINILRNKIHLRICFQRIPPVTGDNYTLTPSLNLAWTTVWMVV